MAMKAVRFRGAKRDAYVPDWMQIDIRIVSHPRVRSYTRYTHQVHTTYHDTGNPRSNAEGEYTWLAQGRPGGVVGGYQFIFDDKKVIQTGMLDEESWHAGTPAGNRSFGAEHAFGNGADWLKSLEIGCALHGALIEMQEMDIESAAVLHQFWTGKYCSAQILNRGQWPMVRQKIIAYARAAAEARKGNPIAVDPGPVYALPSPIIIDGKKWDGSKSGVVNGVQFHAERRTVTVNPGSALNARMYAGTASALVGSARAAGSKITVIGWCGGELVGDEPRWWIGSDHARYWAGGTVEKPSAWTDHKADEQLQPGVRLVNGRAYYPFVDDQGAHGRTLRVTGSANVRKWASTDSAIVGTRKEGDTIQVGWWTIGDKVGDESVWFVIDGGEADPLNQGGRIWAGLTSDRPK